MAGSVVLVGAGPGDPGLLTLAGKQALETAQVVLYDRLVGDAILAMIPDCAQKINVGKSSGRHLIPQGEINRLILDYAEQGLRVVRLKGGDPYLFGRGAEELETVANRGIPFRVVPGITSALAVPAYGGIPVSHRQMASSVHILTGHPRHGAAPEMEYGSLVRLGGTLVFLMGVGALEEIASGLMAAGMSGTTPCALIENGTRPGQRRLVTTVAALAAESGAQGFRPPSVLVVGEVCTLAHSLDWFSRLPLTGARALVTRAKAAADTLSARLRELGGDVIEYPCIRTEALAVEDAIFANLSWYGWLVFTSRMGVEQFFAELTRRGLDLRVLAGVKLAAIGSKTAAALTARGLLPALVPAVFDAAHLADALLEAAAPGERVLLFRARSGTPGLASALLEGGLAVDDIAAYETLYGHPDATGLRTQLEAGDIDYVLFTSASTVEGFARSLPGLDASRLVGVCIGRETAKAAGALGMEVLVSEVATVESMVERILQEQYNRREPL